MKFKIIVLIHEGHMDELINAFKLVLEKRGTVEVIGSVPNHKDFGDVNIYLSGFKSLGNYLDRSKLHILCQLEELWKDREEGMYRKAFQNFDLVLELYEENTKMRGSERAVFFPLGYSPAFNTMMPDFNEDLDAFFFGSRQGIWGEYRRWEYCDFLHENGFHVLFSDSISGDKRASAIARSKINLFIRHSDKGFYCPLRSLSIQCKRKFLLSEKCQGGYGPYIPGKHFVEFNGGNDLLEKMRYYLNHEKERKEFATTALEDLKKNHSFEDYFNEAVKGVL